MITRIELTNFMSHAHTVIEPAAGLTVLVGPNNVGKSAVVAALQILCHNENSTYVTRHGAKQCAVRIETDDNHTIEWRRKTSPSYLIDGQQFDRLKGSGLPDELHRALRLPKVDAGNDTDFDLHFGTQKSPIFLLGSSSSNAARFFASSSDAIRLVAIQKRHKEKHAEAQREKGRLEAESAQLNAELEQLEPVVGLDDRLEGLEHNFDELTRQQARLGECQRAVAALQIQHLHFAEHAAEVSALQPLLAPPALASTRPLEQLIDSLAAAELRCQHMSALASAAAPLAVPPTLDDEAGIEQLTASLADCTEKVARATDECRALNSLPQLPELFDCDTLVHLTAQLTLVNREATYSQEISSVIGRLSSPPILDAEDLLASLISDWQRSTRGEERWEQTSRLLESLGLPPQSPDLAGMTEACARLESQTVREHSLRSELFAAEQSLAATAALLRASAAGAVCSACGGPLDAERIIARAALGFEGHDHG